MATHNPEGASRPWRSTPLWVERAKYVRWFGSLTKAWVVINRSGEILADFDRREDARSNAKELRGW